MSIWKIFVLLCFQSLSQQGNSVFGIYFYQNILELFHEWALAVLPVVPAECGLTFLVANSPEEEELFVAELTDEDDDPPQLPPLDPLE